MLKIGQVIVKSISDCFLVEFIFLQPFYMHKCLRSAATRIKIYRDNVSCRVLKNRLVKPNVIFWNILYLSINLIKYRYANLSIPYFSIQYPGTNVVIIFITPSLYTPTVDLCYAFVCKQTSFTEYSKSIGLMLTVVLHV